MVKFSQEQGEVKGVFTTSQLDIFSSSELLKQLKDAINHTGKELTLDVSALTFIDSAILGVLLHVHNLALANGKKVVFTNLSNYIQNIFRQSGILNLLHLK